MMIVLVINVEFFERGYHEEKKCAQINIYINIITFRVSITFGIKICFKQVKAILTIIFIILSTMTHTKDTITACFLINLGHH
jgi:hypothetical protein